MPSKPQRASKICSLPRELRRVLRAGRTQEASPVVKLVAHEFRNSKASFLVDPGSDVNLVNLHTLRQETIIGSSNFISITGLANGPVTSFGTFQITIFNVSVELHVVENTLPISPDGILGRPYLQ